MPRTQYYLNCSIAMKRAIHDLTPDLDQRKEHPHLGLKVACEIQKYDAYLDPNERE